MAILQGLLFLFFGTGILLMVYRSLSSGWLPVGPKLGSPTGRLEARKDEQPLFYWLMFVLYGSTGIALLGGGNQGPLLGLLITGPAGLVLGAIGGGIYWFRNRDREAQE